MALNGSGTRDTARVLKISRTTVTETLKKDRHLKSVNEARLVALEPTQTIVHLCQWQALEAEADEMWSDVVLSNNNGGCGMRWTMPLGRSNRPKPRSTHGT